MFTNGNMDSSGKLHVCAFLDVNARFDSGHSFAFRHEARIASITKA